MSYLRKACHGTRKDVESHESVSDASIPPGTLHKGITKPCEIPGVARLFAYLKINTFTNCQNCIKAVSGISEGDIHEYGG